MLFGCKNNSSEDFTTAPPAFKDTITLTRQIINDTLITNRIENITLYKDYLIVKATTKDDKLLSIFNKNTGKLIKSFANIRRGPGEYWKIILQVKNSMKNIRKLSKHYHNRTNTTTPKYKK